MEIRELIYSTLKSIVSVAKVSHEWPKEYKKLPYVFFRVDDRTPIPNFEYNTDSDITISVTVWDKNSVSSLADSITSKMASIQFRKTFEKDNSELDNDLKRIDLRFRSYK